jgi:hypothetical protein
MGEVYRARDTKLNRDVALKILPDSFASDPDRLARFTREAQTLAALNHSNIAHIHGLEESAGGRALVMELVEGEDLSARIARGPIPLDEALSIAKQIAGALEAAHEQAIVHRDLKPANVKVRADGTVKVLDFGLAKAIDRSGDGVLDSPTITSPAMTMHGVILGTAAYMAPEQAKGKPVDRRIDIWAFGCVLYEMLSGVRAFDGEDVTDILGAIVKTEPDWSRLPATTPPAIRTLLGRCLKKDRAQRLRNAGDACLEIDEAMSAPLTGVGSPGAPPRWKQLAALLMLAGAVVGAAASRVWWARSADTPQPTLRVSIAMPLELDVSNFRLAPDGSRLAVLAARARRSADAAASTQIYSRRLDAYEFALLGGTEGAEHFVFSPDSRWLAVLVRTKGSTGDRQLIKLPADGSSPAVVLADWAPNWEPSFTWLHDGDVLVVERDGREARLRRIRSTGGVATEALTLDLGESVILGGLGNELPPGRGGMFIATFSYGGRGYQVNSALLDLSTGRVTPIADNASDAVYLETGHVLFSRADTLLAVPFDLNQRTVTGGATALLSGLHSFAGPADFEYAPAGAIAYVEAGQATTARQLVVVDAAGTVTPFVAETGRLSMRPAAERGGTRALVTALTDGAQYEAMIADASRGTLRRWTPEQGVDVAAAMWSPDGQWIAYSREGLTADDGIYIRRADGAGAPVKVGSSSNSEYLFHSAWLPDGSGLIVNSSNGPKADIFLLPLPIDGKMQLLRPLRVTSHAERDGDLSPDGRVLAYSSNESGQNDIYVAPFDRGQLGVAQQVSNGACGRAVWVGRRLYYCARPGKLMAVDVTGSSALSVSAAKEMYDLVALRVPLQGWDVLADGRLLAIQRHVSEERLPSINLVLNWGGELRARLRAQ